TKGGCRSRGTGLGNSMGITPATRGKLPQRCLELPRLEGRTGLGFSSFRSCSPDSNHGRIPLAFQNAEEVMKRPSDYAREILEDLLNQECVQNFIEETNETHSLMVDDAFVRTLRASGLISK